MNQAKIITIHFIKVEKYKITDFSFALNLFKIKINCIIFNNFLFSIYL